MNYIDFRHERFNLPNSICYFYTVSKATHHQKDLPRATLSISKVLDDSLSSIISYHPNHAVLSIPYLYIYEEVIYNSGHPSVSHIVTPEDITNKYPWALSLLKVSPPNVQEGNCNDKG